MKKRFITAAVALITLTMVIASCGPTRTTTSRYPYPGSTYPYPDGRYPQGYPYPGNYPPGQYPVYYPQGRANRKYDRDDRNYRNDNYRSYNNKKNKRHRDGDRDDRSGNRNSR